MRPGAQLRNAADGSGNSRERKLHCVRPSDGGPRAHGKSRRKIFRNAGEDVASTAEARRAYRRNPARSRHRAEPGRRTPRRQSYRLKSLPPPYQGGVTDTRPTCVLARRVRVQIPSSVIVTFLSSQFGKTRKDILIFGPSPAPEARPLPDRERQENRYSNICGSRDFSQTRPRYI